MSRFILQFIIIAYIFVGVCSQALALDVENVRLGAHSDKTRLVVELSDVSDFRAFSLPKDKYKPYRIVLDLPYFTWKAGQIAKPVQTNVLDVRSGTLDDKIKRIVIDVKTPSIIKEAFFLPKSGNQSNRLVIDFATVSVQDFENQKSRIFGNLNEQKQVPKTIETIIAQNRVDASQSNQNIVLPPKKPNKLSEITGSPTVAKTSPLRKPLIVIDAGHGGQDPGAIGHGKSKEKHVTLAAARMLKKKLESSGQYRVYLTRDSDTYLKLFQRRNIARQKEADLFISLHADSIDKPDVRGASIYTLSNKASDAQTARLAARENQADLIAGIDLSHEDKEVADILIDLAMRDTMNQSKFFANTVVDKMKKNDIRVLTRPHRYAGFAVLKSPDVPSVLFEMGFMSNRGEERLLTTSSYQEKIASALAQSIDAYFQKIQKNSLQ